MVGRRCRRKSRSPGESRVLGSSPGERRHPIPPTSIHPSTRRPQPSSPPSRNETSILQRRTINSPCGAHCFVGRPVSDVVDLLLWSARRLRLANFGALFGNTRRFIHIRYVGVSSARGNFGLRNAGQRPLLLFAVLFFFTIDAATSAALSRRQHPRRTRVTERWESKASSESRLLAIIVGSQSHFARQVVYLFELGPQEIYSLTVEPIYLGFARHRLLSASDSSRRHRLTISRNLRPSVVLRAHHELQQGRLASSLEAFSVYRHHPQAHPF